MNLRKNLALTLVGIFLIFSTSFAGTVQTGTYGWTGTYNANDTGSSISNLQGAGTRMLWYPELGVFRAGLAESTYWDFANLGDFSFGFGKNTVASGDYSFSMGQSYYWSGYNTTIPNHASGMNSFAFGRAAQATGAYSFAMGDIDPQSFIYPAQATGLHSFSFGYGTSALSNYSLVFGYRSKADQYAHAVAIGYVAQAFGSYSFSVGRSTTVSSGATGGIAMGYESTAAKSHSVALGYSNMAGNSYSGVGSFALGFDTMALADYSFSAGYRTLADNNNSDDLDTGPYSSMNAAFGNQTISRGNACFVVGSFNHPSIFTATPDDLARPLFVVGNGTSTAAADRSNAFVVFANGNAKVSGTLTTGATTTTEAITANGHITGNSGLTIEGGTTLIGTVLILEAQGDIAMGEFQ